MKKMDSDKRPDYVKLTEAYSGKTESCNVDLWVGFFPYQDGSKTTILSSSECKSNTDYSIDVVNFEKQIQDYIRGIINN
ncbi:MAG: hypothetical protein LRY51_12340 [Geovibrio sp.]|nr:hypothetical protein [Geovibrio sp.]